MDTRCSYNRFYLPGVGSPDQQRSLHNRGPATNAKGAVCVYWNLEQALKSSNSSSAIEKLIYGNDILQNNFSITCDLRFRILFTIHAEKLLEVWFIFRARR